MKRKTVYLWTLVLCTFLFMSCASRYGKDTITVYGMVYDGKNNPVQDYSVFINDKIKAVTDFGGRFVIYDVPEGMCRVDGNKAGFSSTSENLYLDGKKILYLRVQDMEELYADCFDLIEKGRYDEAEKSAVSIMDLAPEDENGICFLSVIEILRKAESKQEEESYEI